MTLFQGTSLHDVLQTRLDGVRKRIGQMSLGELSNPAITGQLEKLWSAGKADVPVLDRVNKRGSRKEVTNRRTDYYGREVSVQSTVVDVRVPYRGDAQMFQLRPSRSSILNERVEVRGGHLHYTMPLDAAEEPRFEKMLDQIEGNLATLRTEADSFDSRALQELQQVAGERRLKLEEEKKKAGGFSFDID